MMVYAALDMWQIADDGDMDVRLAGIFSSRAKAESIQPTDQYRKIEVEEVEIDALIGYTCEGWPIS
jgi:hypothetical protein